MRDVEELGDKCFGPRFGGEEGVCAGKVLVLQREEVFGDFALQHVAPADAIL
jgi:hypothetical protein